MKLTMAFDARPLTGALDFSARQLPYVAAVLLNKLASDGREAVQKKMPQVFDRPTDYTLRGIFTESASKSKLSAKVFVPASTEDGGKSKREYMWPGVEGKSRRNQKRTEFLLTRTGALPPGWVTVPGKGAQLNAYGNIPGLVYKQIINVLQIRGDAKPVSQRSAKGARRLGVTALFFAVAPGANGKGKGGGWLPPGVWKHLPGGKLTQILKFVRKASYKQRLDMPEVVGAAVAKNLSARWGESASVIMERFARNAASRGR